MSGGDVNGLRFCVTGIFKKFFCTVLILLIFRFGTYVPIPGIDPIVVSRLLSGGAFGMFNVFSGGALGRMTVFALNVMPYIVASIVVQLFVASFKSLSDLKQDGEAGRRKISRYARYLTVLFSAVQGIVILVGLEHVGGVGDVVVLSPGLMFRVTGVCSLVAGTMILMWLGDKITEFGLGNGISLIIFTGIISEIPGAVFMVLSMSKNGALSFVTVPVLLLVFIILVSVVVFFERSGRKILVQYPKRQMGNKLYGGSSVHIPLKINMAGAVPPIFANALLLFPVAVAKFYRDASWSDFLLANFSMGKPLYVLCYAVLIGFFSFFYVPFVFDSNEVSNLLKKNGGFVLGKRPGDNTRDYFDYVVSRVTVIGAVYLSFVCLCPEILRSYFSVPFILGGTSVLIMVSVVLDVFSQIHTHMVANHYDSLRKGARMWK